MPKFSVIIPVYNEKELIVKAITKVNSYFSSLKKSFEIIVVNDGSSDKTELLAKKFLKKIPYLKLVSYSPNQGKGYAVRQGILAAKGEIILFTDCDLSSPIRTFAIFLSHFKQGADIVIGSRRQKQSKILIAQPPIRRLLNSIFHRLVFLLVPLEHVTDTTCGFKSFTKEAAKKVFSLQTINGWGFDVEILYIAQLLGYKVVEVPVVWANRRKTHVRLMAALPKTLKELVVIRLNKWLGKYFRQ